MKRVVVHFLVPLVWLWGCGSDTSSNDDGSNTNTTNAGATTGGTTGGGAGTGLALGTFCLKAGSDPERCETSGNVATRVIEGGNISITLEHGTNFTCSAVNDFTASTTVPEGVPLPYNVTQAAQHYTLPSTSCEYVNAGASVSGTIYQAGTDGAVAIEGELSFSAQTPYAACQTSAQLPSLDDCPQSVASMFRFHLPL